MELHDGNKYVLDTPSMSHASHHDWEFVYEPAEDTFLLLDALEKDMDFIVSRKPRICLEVGSGSGSVITALSKGFGANAHCLAVDINKHACQLTRTTSSRNDAFVDVICGDLTRCVRDFSVDMIVFNPPYVVTSSDELKVGDSLTKSWAGGRNGREVIDRFLDALPRAVDANEGFGYVVLVRENDPEDVMNVLRRRGMECVVAARRRVRGEELHVVKFAKSLRKK